jgi:hypothetical protein
MGWGERKTTLVSAITELAVCPAFEISALWEGKVAVWRNLP